jgi:hypothetical protein
MHRSKRHLYSIISIRPSGAAAVIIQPSPFTYQEPSGIAC